ncbi:WD40-repeat-containing domain protein [Suillus spraguei]|nr:WD40-repeat-containing domain protein [Suillus spraguei]
MFSARFPNTLRVVFGHDMDWPAVQTVLTRHTRSVLSVSFSPDGSRIVTGSRDQIVLLWDAATRQPVGEPLRGHTDLVNSVSFSPDGTHIVTCSRDKTIWLWDTATGQSVGEPLRGHADSVLSISFSPDGTRIITSSLDKAVRLWDAATRQPVGEPLQGHTDIVWSASFSSDGTRIVTGSQDMTVRVWDTATGKPVGGPLRGHTHSIRLVSFSPDGTRIVTGSDDKTVRLWDASTRQLSHQCDMLDPSAFSDKHPKIKATTMMTLNTRDNHFISFSSNPIHVLCNTSELMDGASHDDRSSTPTAFVLNVDSGWVVGPQCRLLFWVPPASRHSFYNPETILDPQEEKNVGEVTAYEDDDAIVAEIRRRQAIRSGELVEVESDDEDEDDPPKVCAIELIPLCEKLEAACIARVGADSSLDLVHKLRAFRAALRREELQNAKQATLDKFWNTK